MICGAALNDEEWLRTSRCRTGQGVQRFSSACWLTASRETRLERITWNQLLVCNGEADTR